jgi:hypothetical protein
MLFTSEDRLPRVSCNGWATGFNVDIVAKPIPVRKLLEDIADSFGTDPAKPANGR